MANMSRRSRVFTATLALAVAGCLALLGAIRFWAGSQYGDLNPNNPNLSLADVERTVAVRFAAPEITARELDDRMASGDVVVFDVREPDEFETSHLAGAIRVDPDMDAKAFGAQHGDRLKGKTAVFYCAVGVRSAVLLKRVEPVIAASSPAAAYSLRGGIFRWYADGRRIETAGGPADHVHHFDANWAKLLARTVDRRL